MKLICKKKFTRMIGEYAPNLTIGRKYKFTNYRNKYMFKDDRSYQFALTYSEFCDHFSTLIEIRKEKLDKLNNYEVR